MRSCALCGRDTRVEQLCEQDGRSVCAACLIEAEGQALLIRPIGVIHNELGPSPSATNARSDDSQIHIYEPYRAAMTGLVVGNLLQILFAFRPCADPPLLQHSRGDTRRGLRGVFCLCSPKRPNPIGLTTVKLVARDECSLCVQGLDAWDGSLLLDIKPYVPFADE